MDFTISFQNYLKVKSKKVTYERLRITEAVDSFNDWFEVEDILKNCEAKKFNISLQSFVALIY